MTMGRTHRYLTIDPALCEQAREGLARLTPAEWQHLDLIMAGHTAKQAARITSNSPRTVELHRQNIREKLGARDVLHLALILCKLELDEALHALDGTGGASGNEAGIEDEEAPFEVTLH
jgi:DNA-binding NarL/FixJ family response regulator